MRYLLKALILLFSISFYGQNKIYFTEEFKELPSVDSATYYSTYEKVNYGTQRKTYLLDGTIRNSDFFSNYKRRIREGTSITWHKSGSIEKEEFYSKGKLEGISNMYYESGTIKRTENYKKGEFVDGKCFDDNGIEKAFFPYYLHPEYPGGKKEFYTYLADTFKAPTNIKGQVIISFFVETDGTLNDFKIIKSINKEIDLAVIKVLVNALRWTPGQIDGVITRAKYTLPLTFQ